MNIDFHKPTKYFLYLKIKILICRGRLVEGEHKTNSDESPKLVFLKSSAIKMGGGGYMDG